MKLSHLTLTSFRNIRQLDMPISSHGFTIIHGKNGSGKTSILEAIYLMSCGKSFRAPHLSQLTNMDAENFLIRLALGETSAGLSRNKESGEVSIKINQESGSFTDLAQLLPVRMISPVDTVNLVLGGPEKRRSFLDWGLFHVKHDYWRVVKQLNKIIKQKNAALKGRCSQEELLEWNKQMAKTSIEIDTLRTTYFSSWAEGYYTLMQNRELYKNITFSYYSGWDSKESLLDLLSCTAQRERDAGHCLLGPQRADMHIYSQGTEIKELFSRGQQKLLAIAMFLSQGELLSQSMGRHPLYLIDDFTSELDQASQALLLELLSVGDKQTVITALDLEHPALKTIAQESNCVFEIVDG